MYKAVLSCRQIPYYCRIRAITGNDIIDGKSTYESAIAFKEDDQARVASGIMVKPPGRSYPQTDQKSVFSRTANSVSSLLKRHSGLPVVKKNEADVSMPKDKERLMLNFLLIDILVCIIRIGVAILSNSMAMYTTAARAIISILTAFIAWVSLRFASRDENDAFNYGYGKIESISSTIKGAALLISFVMIIFTAVSRLGMHSMINVLGAQIAIGFSLFFTLGNVYRWTKIRRFLAKGDRSPVLWSQYSATNSSIIVNAGSLISVTLSVLLISYPWAAYIDPIISILLSGFILLSAYSILSSSMTDLMDKALDESMQLIIVGALAEYFEEYTQILGVRSRKSGGIIFIELILEFDADRKIGEIQAVTDRMQRSLEAKIHNSHITIVPRSAEPGAGV